jgi:hypothetical protein
VKALGYQVIYPVNCYKGKNVASNIPAHRMRSPGFGINMIGGTMNCKKISLIASTFLALTNPGVVNADYTQNCYWSVKSFSIERSIDIMSPKG